MIVSDMLKFADNLAYLHPIKSKTKTQKQNDDSAKYYGTSRLAENNFQNAEFNQTFLITQGVSPEKEARASLQSKLEIVFAVSLYVLTLTLEVPFLWCRSF